MQDPNKFQGYECLQSDFDICLRCLLKYKDVRSAEDEHLHLRKTFQDYLMESDEPHIVIGSHDHNLGSEPRDEESSFKTET